MRVIRHWREVPGDLHGAVAAFGNFDGVHRGHAALINHAKALAQEAGAPSAACVLEPHPREFFRPNDPPFRLTNFDTRARLLERLAPDAVFVVKFDAGIACMEAGTFVRAVLKEGLRLSRTVVGSDFRFGRGRAGDAEALEAAGKAHGVGVTVFAPVLSGGEKISSTKIREALRDGRPQDAAAMLGHWWAIEGHVARGDERGRALGFPTVNLALQGVIEPRLGVYAVRVEEEGKIYDGVANFGRRPTFDKKDAVLEVHLFDFAGDLYGKRLSVSFVEFIREERKFDGVETLKAQIAKDCAEARRLLKLAGPSPSC